MQKDPALLRASKLRAIISMPEYSETIGRWIKDLYEAALSDMSVAKEPWTMSVAQGRYSMCKELQENFEKVFLAERAALEKLNRKKGPNHDD